jgi:hypothetical protein
MEGGAVIGFTRASSDALNTIFERMATTQPNLYLAFATALRDADRVAADAVVGEEDPEMLLRRQGAARQLRALLVLATSPVGPQRSDSRATMDSMPQL